MKVIGRDEYIALISETPRILIKKSDTAHNYLLIDEVQEIEEFEKTLRYWVKQEAFDVIVTGSNAFLLSSEIATLFAGRHTTIKVYGLNYQEFLQFYQLQDSDESLVAYMKWGGLPFLYQIPLDDVRSLTDYMGYLCDTYLIDKVERYDIKGKRVFEQQEKYYFEDLGIRNYLCQGKNNNDMEKNHRELGLSAFKTVGIPSLCRSIYFGRIRILVRPRLMPGIISR